MLQGLGYVICQICESYHDSIEELNAHYERDHPTGSKLERKHKCEFCDRSYSQTSHLYSHQRKVHGRETGKREPKPHHPNMTSDGKYKCEFCDKEYSRSKHMYSHQRQVHGHESEKQRKINQGKFPCESCDKRFLSKQYIRHHQKTVHNVS